MGFGSEEFNPWIEREIQDRVDEMRGVFDDEKLVTGDCTVVMFGGVHNHSPKTRSENGSSNRN